MEEDETQDESIGKAIRSKLSRRKFLTTAAIGAAAVGVATAAPNAVKLASGFVPAVSNAAGSGPLVAYVRDASTGEVAVMMGTKEIVLKDFGLVSRLLGMIAG